MIANINVNTGRSGLDTNTILGSIHTFELRTIVLITFHVLLLNCHPVHIISPAAGPDATTFQPGSDKALLNHYTTVNSFRGDLYSINSGIVAGAAVNIGRYKEDTYYNGSFRPVILLNK